MGIIRKMTIGGRTYEILGILNGNELQVTGYTVVDRAKNMNAHLGKDDRENLLAHQDEVPAELLEEGTIFVFTDDRHPRDSEYVSIVYRNREQRLVQDWMGLAYNRCFGCYKVLHRMSL